MIMDTRQSMRDDPLPEKELDEQKAQEKLKNDLEAAAPSCPTDDELIDQIMQRNPLRQSRPIHPGAERFRRDSR